MGLLRGHVVAEGVSQAGPLQGGREGDKGVKRGCHTEQSRAEQSKVSDCKRGLRLTPTTASNRREDVRSWERWWAEGRDSWEQLL